MRYATQVVAASNSLNKAAADFVCTGANDQTTIQAAISAIVAGPFTHGKVLLMEGTYTFGGTGGITNGGKFIGIEGMGGSDFGAISVINVPSTNTGPTIQGFQYVRNIGFTGGGAGLTSAVLYNNAEVSHCFLNISVANTTGGNVAMIWATSNNYALVRDNYVRVPNAYIGIRLSGLNERAYGNQINLLTSSVSGIDIDGDSNAEVFSNFLTGSCTSGGIRVGGISGTSDAKVYDNNLGGVNTGTGDGIRVGAVATSFKPYVSRNIVRAGAAMANGINILGNASGALVVHNDCRGSGTVNSVLDAGVGSFLNMDGSANNWNLL